MAIGSGSSDGLAYTSERQNTTFADGREIVIGVINRFASVETATIVQCRWCDIARVITKLLAHVF